MKGIKQVELIICTHGCFSKEIVKSAEMIIGKMKNIRVYALLPGMSMDDLKMKIETDLDHETHYLSLVDLYGGTPYVTLMSLMKSHHINVVTGLNLAMLIEVYSLLGEVELNELSRIAVATLKESGHLFIHEEMKIG